MTTCNVRLPAADGRGSVDVLVAEIEGGSLGISLTERDGLSMRRVCAETTDIGLVRQLHEAFGAYLQRHGGQ